MGLIEIEDIALAAPKPGKIGAFALDAPPMGPRDVYDIEVAGWVLGEEQPVVEIELHHGGTVLRRTPVEVPRPDVLAHYPGSLQGERSGFRFGLSVIGLEPRVDLQVRAVLADGS